MKDSDAKALNSLFQNASMGVSSIKQVLPKVHDKNLKGELLKQMNTYHDESNSAVSELKQGCVKPKEEPLMTRLMAKAGIAMNLAANQSSQKIAEMMIQGTNMGVIKINKTINSSKNLSPQTARQAKNMLENEQIYIDSLKKYL